MDVAFRQRRDYIVGSVVHSGFPPRLALIVLARVQRSAIGEQSSVQERAGVRIFYGGKRRFQRGTEQVLIHFTYPYLCLVYSPGVARSTRN